MAKKISWYVLFKNQRMTLMIVEERNNTAYITNAPWALFYELNATLCMNSVGTNN